MKKVISLFLSAMMILTSVLCVNFSAFAKDIESSSIKLGKNTVKASEFVYKDDEVDKTKINFSFTLAQKHTLTQGYDSYIDIDDNAFKSIEAIIYSMTPAERSNPALLNGSRRQRIAKGSGTNIQEVNRLLKQFDQTRKMMKMVTGSKMGKMMPKMK